MPNQVDTNAPYGDKGNLIKQAVGLFQQNMQRSSSFGHLTGKMSKQKLQAMAFDPTGTYRTSPEMPVVRSINLSRHQGDEITFNLVQPVNAIPIMGSEYAEGRGIPLSITGDRLRINQARFVIDLGNTMTDIRSPVDFREQGTPIAQDFMNRYVDQSLLVHAAGARGFHGKYNPAAQKEWIVPIQTHPKFESVMVNRVRAPSKNRHFLADNGSIKGFNVVGDDVDISSTDVLNMDSLDSFRAMLDEMPLPPQPIRLAGDPLADESPLRCLYVTAAQFNAFARDPNFRQYVAASHTRSSLLKQHPLFLGDVGLWNGILIRKLPRPIRFYAGDPINYCSAFDSEEESQATVPMSFGTSFAIDRAILLGGSAIGEALGSKRNEAGGLPFFWKEKLLDHDDKAELAIGTIRGASKIRFAVNVGNGLVHYTDNGICVLDTVVKINS